MNETIIGIIGIIVGIVITLTGIIYKRRKKRKQFYEIIWKKSSSLKPEEILGLRPYCKYYYEREEDKIIIECLNKKENVLIIGPPLAGKTRAVYQAITNLNKLNDIIIPRCTDIILETFIFPKHFKFWRKRTIFIDDLHRFVEQQNFEYLISTAIKNDVVIVATCRSKMEYEKAKNKMLEKNIDLKTIFGFGKSIFELEKVSVDIGKKITTEVGKTWNDIIFDGTVGSIFMPLGEMERRFSVCTNIERTILQTIRNLYFSGIYEENQIFPLYYIKILAEKYGLVGKDFEWTGWLDELKSKEFIKIVSDKVQAEEVYLEYIVKPNIEISRLDIFKEMVSVFSNEPYALFGLGYRAYLIGIVELEKAEYMKTTIKAYEGALKVYTFDRYPMDYAMTQNNLGNAYSKLAEVEAKAENCKKANNAFEEALKVRTLDRFPMDYAMTQNNIGNAYSTLAEVEAKTENCKKAIKALEKALKVYTFDHYPMGYAMTQHNLGTAYSSLAEVEAKTENCKKAIKALEEALKVRTLDRFPMQYASTQHNLGTAYSTLAEVEAKAENCKKAIKALVEALKVRTLDRFPMDYAMTQNNLGIAYSTLAEVEAKAENCKKAIKAHVEALKVRTLDRFSMQYASTHNNLGTAYNTLAEVEDKAENCKKAIKAFEEALKVRTLDRFPMDYAITQNNLGITYKTLAEVETKAENCKKATISYKEALKVFTKKEYPEICPIVESNLRRLLHFCGGE